MNWFMLIAPLIAMIISALDQAIEFSEDKLESASDTLLKKLGEVGQIFVDPDPDNLRQLREKWNAEKNEIVPRLHTMIAYLIEKKLGSLPFVRQWLLYNLPFFENKLLEVELDI